MHIQKIILQIWLIFLVMGLHSVGLSQTTKSISVEMAYDDNAFRNYQGLSDYVTKLNIFLARDFEKEFWGIRLYYDVNLNIFAEYTERFSHYHKFGLATSRSKGENGAVLNFGGNIAINRYKSVYDYTDYVQVKSYVNYKFQPKKSMIALN